MKILVVDDSAVMRRIVCKTLQQLGYATSQLLQASDGAEALELLLEHGYEVDVVLSDCNMPGIDGLELCRRLRHNPQTQSIPFIMLTGQNESDSVHRAMSCGVNHYLIKPFSAAQLQLKMAAVEEGLLGRSQRRASTTAVFRFAKAAILRRDADQTLLDRLPQDLVALLYEHGTLEDHTDGATVAAGGQPVDDLLIVHAGTVEVAWDDAPDTPEAFRHGTAFLTDAFAAAEPADGTAGSKGPTTVLRIERHRYREMATAHPCLSALLQEATPGLAPSEPLIDSSTFCGGPLLATTLLRLVLRVHNKQSSGRIHLYREDRFGVVHLAGGNLTFACCTGCSGPDALNELICWDSGRYLCLPKATAPKPNLYGNTLDLVADAARYADAQAASATAITTGTEGAVSCRM